MNPLPPNTEWLTYCGPITDDDITQLYQHKYGTRPTHIVRWQTFTYAGPVPNSDKPDTDETYSLEHPFQNPQNDDSPTQLSF